MFPLRNEGSRLLLIFTLGSALPFVLLVFIEGGLQSVDWPAWGLAFFLHFTLTGTYGCTYTGVTAFSPTIGIVDRVEESMPDGLPRDQLAPTWFTDQKLSGARRENLLATGFISESDGVLQLTPRGRQIVGCLRIFRGFLGLPDVGKG
jgi:hypothetical protein